MPQVDAKVKLGMEFVSDGLQNDVNKHAKEAGKKAQKEMGKTADAINKGGKKLTFGESVKSQLEKVKVGIESIGIGGDKLSKIGELFKGGGWIAVAAIGITAIAKGAMEMWDKMTLSAEQKMLKAEKLKQLAEKDLEKSFTDSTNADEYFKRLAELNQLEKLSNLEKMEAIAIINALTKTYGDLGISIDQATGKIINLNQAFELLKQRDHQQKIKSAETVFRNAHDSANEFARPLIEKLFTNKFTGNTVGLDYFGIEGLQRGEHKKGLYARMNTEKGISVQYVQGHKVYMPRKLTDEEIRLRKLWNDGGISGMLEFLQDRLKKATTQDQISGISELIAKLQVAQKALKELEAIKRHGFKTDQERLKFLKAENTATRSIVENVKKQAAEFLKAREMKEETEFYSGLRPTSVKLQYQNVKLSEETEALKPLLSISEELKKKVQTAEKALNDALSSGNMNQIELAYKTLNQLLQESAKADGNVQQQQNKIVNIQMEIARLNRLISEQKLRQLKSDAEKIKFLQNQLKLQQAREQNARKQGNEKVALQAKMKQLQILNEIQILQDRSKNFYQDEKSNLDFELKLLKLKLQGKYEEIELLKLQNKIKKDGLIIDEKQIQAILEKRKALNQFNANQAIQDQARSLMDSISTDDRNYQIQKRIEQIEKANSVKLTSSQKRDVEKLYDLQQKIKKIQGLKLDLGTFDLKSNQLTARGGFQTGTVMPDIVSINKSIRDYSEKTANAITQIKAILKNGWKI